MKKSSKAASSKAKKEKKSLSLAKRIKTSVTEDYTLITLDAETRKPVTPKQGKQIFFAWKDAQGKIYPIESQNSQAYYKTDADGIRAAFRAGSPDAYNVYKVLTKTASTILDKDGNPVTETHFNKQTGEVKKLFRLKITGRKFGKGVMVAVHSVTGFLLPLTRGVSKQLAREIPLGSYVKIPVTYGNAPRKVSELLRFTGGSIRDMMNGILPDTTTAELVRRGIRMLEVNGMIQAYRPENPYAEETLDFYDREKWADKIWKGSQVRSFRVDALVPSLVNFASRVATGFRKSFSRQGLRITSMVELEEAEDRQRLLDETIFKLLDPIWPSVILEPQNGVRYKLSAKGKHGEPVPAGKYFPMRYEAGSGEPVEAPGSSYETVMTLTLSIRGF